MGIENERGILRKIQREIYRDTENNRDSEMQRIITEKERERER